MLDLVKKDQLNKYRLLVSDPAKGKELSDILNKILKNKKYQLGGKFYKKTPRGYESDYKYADLLLHNGIYVFYESTNLNEIIKKNTVDFALKIYKELYPLHRWLVNNMK
jgi:hypothetical protein